MLHVYVYMKKYSEPHVAVNFLIKNDMRKLGLSQYMYVIVYIFMCLLDVFENKI